MLDNKLGYLPTNPVFLVVWLNFTLNGKQGCDKHCELCNFTNYSSYLCPSIVDLKAFLTNYGHYSKLKHIMLSGGGDPLFQFEKNKDKVLGIIKACKDLGFGVVIQTQEIEVVKKYYKSALKDVIGYYFASEKPNETIYSLAVDLLKEKKSVAITKILNRTEELTLQDRLFMEE